MSHPIIYALGETEAAKFPLILTIGREPNYDDVLVNVVGQIDVHEFGSQPGGAWVTAYSQIAKQHFGRQSGSGQLKALCFKRNASPILFANAFPVALPHKFTRKEEFRKQLTIQIPEHIDTLFSSALIDRVQLVIQHGVKSSEPHRVAQEHVRQHCGRRGIHYISTRFFCGQNSLHIQEVLAQVKPQIDEIMSAFAKEFA